MIIIIVTQRMRWLPFLLIFIATTEIIIGINIIFVVVTDFFMDMALLNTGTSDQ